MFLLRAKTRDDYINAVFVDVSVSVYDTNLRNALVTTCTFVTVQFEITIMYLAAPSATCLCMFVKIMKRLRVSEFQGQIRLHGDADAAA